MCASSWVSTWPQRDSPQSFKLLLQKAILIFSAVVTRHSQCFLCIFFIEVRVFLWNFPCLDQSALHSFGAVVLSQQNVNKAHSKLIELQNHIGWNGTLEVIWSNSAHSRPNFKVRTGFSGPIQKSFENIQWRRSCNLSGQSVPVSDLLHCHIFSVYAAGPCCRLTVTSFHFSVHVSFCLLYNPLLGSSRLQLDSLLSLLFSRVNMPSSLSLSLYATCASSQSPLCPTAGPSSVW